MKIQNVIPGIRFWLKSVCDALMLCVLLALLNVYILFSSYPDLYFRIANPYAATEILKIIPYNVAGLGFFALHLLACFKQWENGAHLRMECQDGLTFSTFRLLTAYIFYYYYAGKRIQEHDDFPISMIRVFTTALVLLYTLYKFHTFLQHRNKTAAHT